MRVCGVRRRRRRDFLLFRFVVLTFFDADTFEAAAPVADVFDLIGPRLLCALSRRRCADDCDCGAVFFVIVIMPPGCTALTAAALLALVFAVARLMFFSFDEMAMGSRWHGLDAEAKANGECGSMPMLVTAADAAAAAAVDVVVEVDEDEDEEDADDEWR